MSDSHLTLFGKSLGTDDRVVANTVLDAWEAYCLVREAPRPLVAPTISALTIVTVWSVSKRLGALDLCKLDKDKEESICFGMCF